MSRICAVFSMSWEIWDLTDDFWAKHAQKTFNSLMDGDLAEGLFDDAGHEGLLGLGGSEGVERELAAVPGAELEEQAGAVGVVGVDGVDEAHPRDAVEVAFVGDGRERNLERASGKALRNDGDAHGRAAGRDKRSGVDEGGQAAVAEGVAGDLLILKGECGRGRRRCWAMRSCGVRGCGVRR
jgi:hypothetical protein